MSETKVLKKFISFLEGVGIEPKPKQELRKLKQSYPNEWAIFAEGELDEKVLGLCIYCGESTKGSNICVNCDVTDTISTIDDGNDYF